MAEIHRSRGRRPDALPGMAAFAKRLRVSRKLLVGANGMPPV